MIPMILVMMVAMIHVKMVAMMVVMMVAMIHVKMVAMIHVKMVAMIHVQVGRVRQGRTWKHPITGQGTVVAFNRLAMNLICGSYSSSRGIWTCFKATRA